MSYYWDDEEFYCQKCDREFTSYNNLKHHLTLSKVHQGKAVRCPRCGKNFGTAAYLIMHIEQGNCIRITHPEITSAIRSWEAATGNPNLMTVPRLAWREEEVWRPEVTEDCFNGYFFECPMCNKEFINEARLQQHVNSPAHNSQEYHCKNCGVEFRLLSSLFQHFESGKCGAISRGGKGLMSNRGYKMLLDGINGWRL